MRAFFATAVLALVACYAFDEGRPPSRTFETHYSAADVRQRSTSHLRRSGYQVLHADDRLVDAEKQRDSGSFDVLRVIVESTGATGTRVRVQAGSEEGSAAGREKARYVSSSALADSEALVDALTSR